MTTREHLATVDDLWQFSQDYPDKRTELYEGIIIEMSPSSVIPSIVAVRIGTALENYIRPRNLGYVTTADGGFELSPNNVLSPDVGFIAKARVAKLPPRYFLGTPDLSVEVMSPTDTYPSAHRKALKYLSFGTRLVWVVDPDERLVEVYHPATESGFFVQPIDRNGTLNGGDVLSGFTLPIRDIFEDLGD